VSKPSNESHVLALSRTLEIKKNFLNGAKAATPTAIGSIPVNYFPFYFLTIYDYMCFFREKYTCFLRFKRYLG